MLPCLGRPYISNALAGANAVPVDIFHSKSTVSAVTGLVSAALDANMNMIRVWGGGLYYRDEFYDACDQYGLLVWQEAMFACSLYPANKAFLDDVSPFTYFSGWYLALVTLCGQAPWSHVRLPPVLWKPGFPAWPDCHSMRCTHVVELQSCRGDG